MTTYEFVDSLVKVIGLLGGLWAVFTWSESQRWKRASELDEFIKTFERDVLVQQAARMLDWQRGTIEMANRESRDFDSKTILDGLRIPQGADSNFTEEEVRIRDAFDAMLSFLGRLELAMQGGFVDPDYTLVYFGYWIRRLHDMDQHVAQGKEAQKEMRDYERAYGPGDQIMSSLFARISGRESVRIQKIG